MPTPTPLTSVQNAPSLTVDACSKMLEAATKSCAATQPTSAPNWDAMASSFAALSSAFAWGSIILAVVAIVAGFTWGKVVTARAEKEAKAMAKACADEYIKDWLANEAPAIIRERVDFLQDATTGQGNDAEAADAMGEGAG